MFPLKFACVVGCIFPLCAAAAVATSQPATAPDDSPVAPPKSVTDYLTEAQLRQAFRAHQFALLLQETVRIQSHPTVLADYHLFDLLVLRGEAYVQTHAYARAMDVFAEAAAVAPDDTRRSFMLATALLVKKQANGKYMSKTSNAEGMLIPPAAPPTAHLTRFDVLDLGQRKAAIHALANDLLTEAHAMVARDYPTLPALEPLFSMIDDAGTAEKGATGDLAETQKLRILAGEKSGLIIQNALDARNQLVRQTLRHGLVVHQRAPDRPGNASISQGTTAITPAIQRQLESVVDLTNQVPEQTARLAKRLQLDPQFFQKIVSNAAAVREGAQSALKNLQIIQDQ